MPNAVPVTHDETLASCAVRSQGRSSAARSRELDPLLRRPVALGGDADRGDRVRRLGLEVPRGTPVAVRSKPIGPRATPRPDSERPPSGERRAAHLKSSIRGTVIGRRQPRLQTGLGRPAITASGRRSLQPHRHHDVACVCHAGRVDEAAAVRVGEPDLHLIALDRTQGVEEIVDVESNLHFLALV